MVYIKQTIFEAKLFKCDIFVSAMLYDDLVVISGIINHPIHLSVLI